MTNRRFFFHGLLAVITAGAIIAPAKPTKMVLPPQKMEKPNSRIQIKERDGKILLDAPARIVPVGNGLKV